MNTPESRLTAARDPDTPGPELEAIYQFVRAPRVELRDDTLDAVARHPNTPLRILASLAGRRPLEVLANPALELFALEDPGWLRHINSRAAIAMLLAPAGRTRIANLLALHLNGAVRALAEQVTLLDETLLDAITRDAPWSSWQARLAELVGELVAERPRLRGVAASVLEGDGLARHDCLPNAWQRAVLESGDLRAIDQLVATRSIPVDRQLALARSPSRGVRWSLARSPSLAPQAAAILARDLEMVRIQLASNPATPVDVLHTLVADRHHTVREPAIENLRRRAAP